MPSWAIWPRCARQHRRADSLRQTGVVWRRQPHLLAGPALSTGLGPQVVLFLVTLAGLSALVMWPVDGQFNRFNSSVYVLNLDLCYSFGRKRYVFSFQKNMRKLADSTDSKILRRIESHKRGWVFTPDSFSDLGTRQAVDHALMRHRKNGLIRKLARGLYDYPKTDPQFGQLQPSTDDIANALAGRDATRLQPSGAYAANLLGLSTQVPMKVVYLTDGRKGKVQIGQIGKRQIILKNTTPRNMATAGRISGLVIQALRHLGRENVDQQITAQLGRRLDDDARQQLMQDIRYAPAWIADIIRRLAVQEGTV